MEIASVRLEIQQTYAKIGLQSSSSRISIEQPAAELQISSSPVNLSIDRTVSKLEIDSSQARAAYGLKAIVPFISDLASAARQQAMAGIARIAQDGDRMMDIANREDAIAELAYQRQFDQSLVEYVESPSLKPVAIQFQPSSIELRWQMGDVEIQVQPNRPLVQVQPGNLEIYLREKAGITINSVGKNVDATA